MQFLYFFQKIIAFEIATHLPSHDQTNKPSEHNIYLFVFILFLKWKERL